MLAPAAHRRRRRRELVRFIFAVELIDEVRQRLVRLRAGRRLFAGRLLRAALAHAGDAVTDESGAIEALGHAPRLVRGDLTNFKLTWPADFALASRLLPEPTHG